MNEIALKHTPFFTAKALHNGRSVVSSNKKLMIVLFVLHMTGLPLVIGVSLLQLLSHERPDADAYMVIACLTAAAAGLAGIACALTSMPYLYRKLTVDMRMSLPITTNQRFVSDYLAGLFTYTVPFAASQIFTLMFMLFGHAMFDGRAEKDVLRTSTSEIIMNYFGEAAPYVVRIVIGYFLMMLVFYAMCVLVMTCCGSILEAIMYSVLLNILVPGCIASVLAAMCEGVRGLDYEFYLQFTLPFSSPTGMMYYMITNLDNDYMMFMSFGKWVIFSLIAFAVYSIAAFLIYRKRKAEDTGKPIVYETFYFVMMTLSVVTLVFLFMLIDDDYIIPMIIVSAIFYFVAAVIRNRGFKKFGRYVIAYVITLVASLVVYFVIEATGAFGAAERVPNPAFVDRVYVSYNGYYNQEDYLSMSDVSPDSFTVIKDRESLQLITEVHRDAVDDTPGLGTTHEFDVLYRMKSGAWVFRRYEISDDIRSKLVSLDLTDEMRERRAAVAQEKLRNIQRRIDEMKTRESYSWNNNPQYIYLTASMCYDMTRDFASEWDKYEKDMRSLPADFAEKLSEAIRADIMEETEEQYYRYEGWCGRISAFGEIVYLKDSYRHTIEYLKTLGFDDLPVLSRENAQRLVQSGNLTIISVPMYERATGQNIASGTGDSQLRYRYFYDKEGIDSLRINYASAEVYIDSDVMSFASNDDNLFNIMNTARNQYYSDDVEYLIRRNGDIYAVPPKYNQIAAQVYEKQFITGLSNIYDMSSLPTETYNSRNIKLFLDVYGADIKRDYTQDGYDMLDDLTRILKEYPQD